MRIKYAGNGFRCPTGASQLTFEWTRRSFFGRFLVTTSERQKNWLEKAGIPKTLWVPCCWMFSFFVGLMRGATFTVRSCFSLLTCVPKASVVLHHYWVISWALLPLYLRFPPYISDNSFVVGFLICTLSIRVATSIISSQIISLLWTYFELTYSVLVWGYTLTWNVSLFLSLLFFSSFRDLRNNLISTVEPGAFRGLLALRRL